MTSNHLLAGALAVFLGLYIWFRVANRRLKKKLVAAEQEVIAARQHYERKMAELLEANQAALAAAENSLAAESEAGRQENERIRRHYQGEAERVFAEAERALTEARDKVKAFEALQALAQDESAVRATLAEALREAGDLRAQALAVLTDAKTRSSIERDLALQKARAIRQQAEAYLSRATTDAARVVADAHRKAEEIAGDAYTALRERQLLEDAIKAARNTIEGYGDRYIIPSRSLIDDLAADFGHLEAGQALAAARDQSRRMVEEGLAAECDYAERTRRDTAIRFVTDAFNGRVDAILTEIEHENHGTLEQRIRDTFSLVNVNGTAFRNARIKPAYLDSRLAELRWAAAAHELKLKEREEQRRIREQMREEERVRREYEKAMKEAQREEELIKQALEKARREAEAAGAEERAKLERQMAELSRQLAEAEAKNQRALSMAQQTRKGNVYIISNVGSFGDDVFKIGMTRRLEPMERIWELGDASVPFEFDVHAIIPSEDAPTLENELHTAFDDLRINQVNLRKEFFRVPLERVRQLVAERGVEAKFTLAAEAQEYRESLAIAKMPPDARARYRRERTATGS
jgi:hypothetical protein